MRAHELARKLMAGPNAVVVANKDRQTYQPRYMWMHRVGAGYSWCQSSTHRRSKNCFSCNHGSKRMKGVLL